MRPISGKRRNQNNEYKETKKKLFLNNLKKGSLRCFFSDKPIKIPQELKHENDDKLMSMLTCHHLNQQRENERLFDKDMMVPTLSKYHNDYHSMNVKQLLNTSWYNSFLFRLKNKNIQIYRKEIGKQLKANIISIKEYETITKEK